MMFLLKNLPMKITNYNVTQAALRGGFEFSTERGLTALLASDIIGNSSYRKYLFRLRLEINYRCSDFFFRGCSPLPCTVRGSLIKRSKTINVHKNAHTKLCIKHTPKNKKQTHCAEE